MDEEFLTKDMIWKLDYGERSGIAYSLQILLEKYDYKIINEAALFVNNNPYDMEFFVVLGVLSDEQGILDDINFHMIEAGGEKITTISQHDLLVGASTGRFNLATIVSGDMVDTTIKGLFMIGDRKSVESIFGYSALKSKKIFISHSSLDKSIIRKVVHYTQYAGFSVFFDEIDIDYGQVIVDEVQKGIDNSNAVIFWITRNFLNSKWCKEEMPSFLDKCIAEDIKIYSFLDKGIEISELPNFIRKRKLVDGDLMQPQEAFRKILPSLQRLLGK